MLLMKSYLRSGINVMWESPESSIDALNSLLATFPLAHTIGRACRNEAKSHDKKQTDWRAKFPVQLSSSCCVSATSTTSTSAPYHSYHFKPSYQHNKKNKAWKLCTHRHFFLSRLFSLFFPVYTLLCPESSFLFFSLSVLLLTFFLLSFLFSLLLLCFLCTVYIYLVKICSSSSNSGNMTYGTVLFSSCVAKKYKNNPIVQNDDDDNDETDDFVRWWEIFSLFFLSSNFLLEKSRVKVEESMVL